MRSGNCYLQWCDGYGLGLNVPMDQDSIDELASVAPWDEELRPWQLTIGRRPQYRVITRKPQDRC